MEFTLIKKKQNEVHTKSANQLQNSQNAIGFVKKNINFKDYSLPSQCDESE
jgi:hypothetical protein